MRTLTVPRQDISAKIYKAYCNAINNNKLDSVYSFLDYDDLDISVGENVALYKFSQNNNEEAINKFVSHPKFSFIDENYKPIIISAEYNFIYLFKLLLDKYDIPNEVLLECLDNACLNENIYIIGVILTYKDFIIYLKNEEKLLDILNNSSNKIKNYIQPYINVQDF